MIKKGTIEYELIINEDNAHGVNYKSDLEGDIAALMIAAEILEHKLDSLKDLKLSANKGQPRKTVNDLIILHKRGLAAINSLYQSLCNSYEDYILAMGAMIQNAKEEAEALQASKENQGGQNFTE